MQHRSLVLATGIYPPDFGGPATYVAGLAHAFTKQGYDVKVLTYAELGGTTNEEGYIVWRVSRVGGSLVRWFRYACALRKLCTQESCVIAFSSVSVGIPLFFSRVRCKKLLRLGGEFFWERVTDAGMNISLREWIYSTNIIHRCCRAISRCILTMFDGIIYSTKFQADLHRDVFQLEVPSYVIENVSHSETPTTHIAHTPFRLLFLGRLVHFKNLTSLIYALEQLPHTTLDIVGDGPRFQKLYTLVSTLQLEKRVQFYEPVSGKEKSILFSRYDLLVLPSLTELSPHTALEARASGLPVLLTEETGITGELPGILLRNLRTPATITSSIQEVINRYSEIAEQASLPLPERTWGDIVHSWQNILDL